jgi:hypothetical protein
MSDVTPRPRSLRDRIEAVRKIIRAAQRVADERATLVDRLVLDTGLSLEGVGWAFDHHLEVAPADAEIEALVASTDPSSDVAVILSSNVFTAALRALAIACASAPRVVVRTSRREPTFASALVRAVGDTSVTLAPELHIADVEHGEIHVYGRDATITSVRASARAGVRVRGHGAGMGVAFASRDANLHASASALARDIVAFDQRGCLSPRIALVIGAEGRAEAFAEALDDALAKIAQVVPRGRLDEIERADARRFRDAMSFVGSVRASRDHVVAVAPSCTTLTVPPSGRHILIVPVLDTAAARRALAPLDRAIVAVGADSRAAAQLIAPSHARASCLGHMQRPPFDGPVDHRTA